MSECAICGDDGVSVDPRFRQGDWCELCQTTWSMLEAKWIKENQDNRRYQQLYPFLIWLLVPKLRKKHMYPSK